MSEETVLQRLMGTWSGDDLRRAFVEGVSWWEYHQTGATLWNSDRRLAEAEAEQRYPAGRARPWVLEDGSSSHDLTEKELT